MATITKKHLSRDTDYALCHTEGFKKEDLVHNMKEWKKLPPSQQCKLCLKEQEMIKRGKYDDIF